MNTPVKTLSITEARKRIFDIAEAVQHSSQYFTLTEHGRARAVVMSAEEFDSWMETLDVASNPQLVRSIRTAQHAFKKKDFISLESVLAEEEHTPVKQKRHVQSRRKKVRTQKSQKD